MNSLSLWAAAGWLALHLGALLAAWGTRAAARSRMESASQIAFFLAMTGVGVSAWMGHQLDSGLWVPSSITLVAMVLVAVVDMQRPVEPQATIWG